MAFWLAYSTDQDNIRRYETANASDDPVEQNYCLPVKTVEFWSSQDLEKFITDKRVAHALVEWVVFDSEPTDAQLAGCGYCKKALDILGQGKTCPKPITKVGTIIAICKRRANDLRSKRGEDIGVINQWHGYCNMQ